MMDKEYLIIYSVNGDTRSYFLETEEELIDNIKVCKRLKFEIIFAAKIAVVKKFIG